jgi:uncharacterized membrane protein
VNVHPRLARLIIAISAGLLIGYAGVWVSISPQSIGRGDFTATYVGATLFREGYGSRIYVGTLQAELHTQVVAPDHVGNLPFVDAPLAAAIAAPVTLLSGSCSSRASPSPTSRSAWWLSRSAGANGVSCRERWQERWV